MPPRHQERQAKTKEIKTVHDIPGLMLFVVPIFRDLPGALGALAANTMPTDFTKPNLQERDRIVLAEASVSR